MAARESRPHPAFERGRSNWAAGLTARSGLIHGKQEGHLSAPPAPGPASSREGQDDDGGEHSGPAPEDHEASSTGEAFDSLRSPSKALGAAESERERSCKHVWRFRLCIKREPERDEKEREAEDEEDACQQGED